MDTRRDKIIPTSLQPFYLDGHIIQPYSYTPIYPDYPDNPDIARLTPPYHYLRPELPKAELADIGYFNVLVKNICKYFQKKDSALRLTGSVKKDKLLIARFNANNASLRLGKKIFSKVGKVRDVIYFVLEPIDKLLAGKFEKSDIALTLINYTKMRGKWWASKIAAEGIHSLMIAAGFTTPAGYVVAGVYTAIIFKEGIYRPLSDHFKKSHITLTNAVEYALVSAYNHIIEQNKIWHPEKRPTQTVTNRQLLNNINLTISVNSRLDQLFPNAHENLIVPQSQILLPIPGNVNNPEEMHQIFFSNIEPAQLTPDVKPVKETHLAMAKALSGTIDEKQILANLNKVQVKERIHQPECTQPNSNPTGIGITSAPCAVEFRTNTPNGQPVSVNPVGIGLLVYQGLGYLRNEQLKTDQVRALENIQSALEYYASFNEGADGRAFGGISKVFNYVYGWGDLSDYNQQLTQARRDAKTALLQNCQIYIDNYPKCDHAENVKTLASLVGTLPEVYPYFYKARRTDNISNEYRKFEWDKQQQAEQSHREHVAAVARQKNIENVAQANLQAIQSSTAEQKGTHVTQFAAYLDSLHPDESHPYRVQLVNAVINDIPDAQQSAEVLQQDVYLKTVTNQLEFFRRFRSLDQDGLEKLFAVYALVNNKEAILNTYKQEEILCQNSSTILRTVRDLHNNPMAIAEKLDKLADKNLHDDFEYGRLLLHTSEKREEGIQRLEFVKQALKTEHTTPHEKQLLEFTTLELAYAYADKQPEKAKECAQDCLNQNPNNSQALLLVGFQHLQTPSTRSLFAAKRILQQVEGTDAANEDAKNLLKYIKQREARYKSFASDLVRSGLRGCLSMNPKSHKIFTRAETAYRLGELLAYQHELNSELSSLKGFVSEKESLKRYHNLTQILLLGDDLLKSFDCTGISNQYKEYVQLGSDAIGLTDTAMRHASTPSEFFQSPATMLIASQQVTRAIHYATRRLTPGWQQSMIYQYLREAPLTIYNDFYYLLQYHQEIKELLTDGQALLTNGALVVSAKVILVAGSLVYTGRHCVKTYQKAKENVYDYTLSSAYQFLNENPTNLKPVETAYQACKKTFPDHSETIKLGRILSLYQNDNTGAYQENLSICSDLLQAEPGYSFAKSYQAQTLYKLALKSAHSGYIDHAALNESANIFQTLLANKDMSAYAGLISIYSIKNQFNKIEILLNQVEDVNFVKTQREQLTKQVTSIWKGATQQAAADAINTMVIKGVTQWQSNSRAAKSTSRALLSALGPWNVNPANKSKETKSVAVNRTADKSLFWKKPTTNPLKKPNYNNLTIQNTYRS